MTEPAISSTEILSECLEEKHNLSSISNRSYLLTYKSKLTEVSIRDSDIFRGAKRTEIAYEAAINQDFTYVWVIYASSYPLADIDFSIREITPLVKKVQLYEEEIVGTLMFLYQKAPRKAYLVKEAKFFSSGIKAYPSPLRGRNITQVTFQRLYPWQETLYDELQSPANLRKVIWYFDKAGSTGKTSFSYWLSDRYASDCLLLDGTGTSSKFSREIYKERKRGWTGKILIIDCPTTSSCKKINYLCIQRARDGGFSWKGCRVEWNPSFVIVFSRFPPVVACMTMDRWDIRQLMVDPAVDYPMESRINAWYYAR